MIERLNREIRRRTRVVGTFPDGNSALMLVCARLRHVAGTQWGCKKYMNMKHLEVIEQDLLVGEWQSAREASRARQAAAAALDPLRPDRPNVTTGAPKHHPVIDFYQIPESNLRINLDSTQGSTCH